MVKWSKIVDHDHGQNSKFLWSNGQKLAIFAMTIAKIPELPRLNGQNLSILTIDHGKFQVVMVMVKFFDH